MTGRVEEPETTGNRSRRTALVTASIGVLAGGAAVAYVVRALVRDWAEASDALKSIDPAWVLAALVLAAAAMLTMADGWRSVITLLGVRVARSQAIAWYFLGELGKYLPGGVWPVLGRGELARRGGVPRSRAYASVGLSLVLLYLAAMFVAVALLPFAVAGSGFSIWMVFLLALPLGLVGLHHGLLDRVVTVIERVSGRSLDIEIPRWGSSVRLVGRYVPSWVLVGASTWCVARALDPNASLPRVAFAAVLSWIAGFFAVPVPAGAGVREAVLAATAGIGGGVAAATALIARLLFTIVDAGGAAASGPFAGRRRRGVGVGPRPEAGRTGHGGGIEGADEADEGPIGDR